MLTFYIAGPISAPTEEQYRANVEAFKPLAKLVWESGHAAFNPAANTDFEGAQRVAHSSYLLFSQLVVANLIDVVCLRSETHESVGTELEVRLARHRRIPIICGMGDLEDFLACLLTNDKQHFFTAEVTRAMQLSNERKI